MTYENVEQLNDRLENASPEEIIRWAIETFGADVAASSSFQTQSVPLLHIISRTCPELPVLFVDTGYQFPETLRFRNELQQALGLNVHTVGPTLTGPCYPAPCDPDRCCHLRKVEPMQRALQRYRAWITGIRRDQTAHRRRARVIEPQPGGLLKVNPLVSWTQEDVQAYIRQHNLPVHPLYEQGYRSVGCAPCTQPVAAGEDDRAGRWAGIEKTECGLHWGQGRIEPQENLVYRESSSGNGASGGQRGAKVFPVCLINLHEKMCVVVGGGAVAERKISALLECQARVIVISPALTSQLRRWAEVGAFTHVARTYRQGDLEDAFLCIAATGDRSVNEQVCHDGDACGVLVNAVDDMAHSRFIAPATVRRGDLTIAVSTGGHSPALAARVKEKVASLFGPEHDALLQILGSLRPRAMAELTPGRRTAFFYAVVDDAEITMLLRHGDRTLATARVEELYEQFKGQG